MVTFTSDLEKALVILRKIVADEDGYVSPVAVDVRLRPELTEDEMELLARLKAEVPAS